MICTLKHHVFCAAFAAMSPLAPCSRTGISDRHRWHFEGGDIRNQRPPGDQEFAGSPGKRLLASRSDGLRQVPRREGSRRPYRRRPDPAKRVKAQGYHYCFVAENMWGGWHRPDPMGDDEAARKAMEDWKRSPGHNANLLSRAPISGSGRPPGRQSSDRVVFRIVQVFGKDCSGKAGRQGPSGIRWTPSANSSDKAPALSMAFHIAAVSFKSAHSASTSARLRRGLRNSSQ